MNWTSVPYETHDTNGLASYLITCKSYDDTDKTLTDSELRLETEDYF